MKSVFFPPPVLQMFASLLLVTVFAPPVANAQNVDTVESNGGTLTGRYADVIVKSGTCTLNGATVFGSVKLEGGSLVSRNGTTIYGSIEARDSGSIQLSSTKVLGEIKLEKSGALTLINSQLGSIVVRESGTVQIKNGSTVEAISLEKSSNLTISDSRVFPGGVTMISSGRLKLVNSEIGLDSDSDSDNGGGGGVSVIQSNAGLTSVVADANSAIDGTVLIEKGTGDVRFEGAALNSDLIVIEQNGDVLVDGRSSGNATLSDVKIEKVSGDIRLVGVITDSDMTIKENGGDVSIESSVLGGDVEIALNQAVTIASNSFALEDILISKNTGFVTIDRNCDMRLSVFENTSGVHITNNNANHATVAGRICFSGFGFTDADVSKNQGGVLIENNTGEALFCSDNDPAPTGSNNSILFVDGQCVGIPGFND